VGHRLARRGARRVGRTGHADEPGDVGLGWAYLVPTASRDIAVARQTTLVEDPVSHHVLLLGGSFTPPAPPPSATTCPITEISGSQTTTQTVQCGSGVVERVQELQDTWRWDGTTWSHADVPGGPDLSRGFAAGYDPGLGAVVLASGLSQGTWTLDGHRWTHVSGEASPDGDHIVYDPATRNMLSYAGYHGDTVCPESCRGPQSTTATFDGRAWVSPAGGEPEPASGAIATDPARGGVLLLNEFRNTWEWDGRQWSQLQPATTPDAVTDQVAVTDEARRSVEVLPVPGAPGTAWEWNGTDWCARACSAAPSGATPTP
ncbi:MAG: hypothetical protein ACREQ5_37675, partial [Candidatus Dormibacteria bacterium]